MKNCVLRCLILLFALTLTAPVYANSGAKEGGASAVAKLEAFTVNLSDFSRYLQVSVTLQMANPELGERIKMFMPIIRHKLILILSSKDSAHIQSPDGKQELMEEIKESLNKVLDLKEHDGVTDIFFENFVIQ